MLCSSWESSGAGKESSPPPSNGLLSCWRGILSRPLPPYSRCCRAEHSPNPSFTGMGLPEGPAQPCTLGQAAVPAHHTELPAPPCCWALLRAAPTFPFPHAGSKALHQEVVVLQEGSTISSYRSAAALQQAAQPSSHSSDCAGQNWKWSFGSSSSIHPCAAIFSSPVITEANTKNAEHQECNDGSQEFSVLSSQRRFGRRNDPAANAPGWLPMQLTACTAFPPL